MMDYLGHVMQMDTDQLAADFTDTLVDLKP